MEQEANNKIKNLFAETAKKTIQSEQHGYSSYVGDKKTKTCVLTAIDRNKASYVKPPLPVALLKNAIELCCAARGHALAIWHRYAPPRCARRPNALRTGAIFASQNQYKNLTEQSL